MKKKFIIIGIIVIIALVIGILFLAKKEKSNAQSYLVELTKDKLEEKINNKDSFILVITREGCSHCAEYMPVLTNVLRDNQVTGYYVDLATLSDGDKKYLNSIANVSGTPTTIFIEDGEEKTVVNRIVGTATRSTIEEKLKSLDYIE